MPKRQDDENGISSRTSASSSFRSQGGSLRSAGSYANSIHPLSGFLPSSSYALENVIPQCLLKPPTHGREQQPCYALPQSFILNRAIPALGRVALEVPGVSIPKTALFGIRSEQNTGKYFAYLRNHAGTGTCSRSCARAASLSPTATTRCARHGSHIS